MNALDTDPEPERDKPAVLSIQLAYFASVIVSLLHRLKDLHVNKKMYQRWALNSKWTHQSYQRASLLLLVKVPWQPHGQYHRRGWWHACCAKFFAQLKQNVVKVVQSAFLTLGNFCCRIRADGVSIRCGWTLHFRGQGLRSWRSLAGVKVVLKTIVQRKKSIARKAWAWSRVLVAKREKTTKVSEQPAPRVPRSYPRHV